MSWFRWTCRRWRRRYPRPRRCAAARRWRRHVRHATASRLNLDVMAVGGRARNVPRLLVHRCQQAPVVACNSAVVSGRSALWQARGFCFTTTTCRWRATCVGAGECDHDGQSAAYLADCLGRRQRGAAGFARTMDPPGCQFGDCAGPCAGVARSDDHVRTDHASTDDRGSDAGTDGAANGYH